MQGRSAFHCRTGFRAFESAPSLGASVGLNQEGVSIQIISLRARVCLFSGRIAELEDHHPDMLVGWRRVTVILSTHAIKGLSVNDFIMAAKSELEYSKVTGS